jgi:hypothetical protein
MTVTQDNIVLEGLPEGAHWIDIIPAGNHWYLSYEVGTKLNHIQLPFPCKLVGIHSREKPLGEEVLKEVVETYIPSGARDYTTEYKSVNTATESFASLLSHVKLHLSNPIEKPLPYLPMPQLTQEYNDYEKAYYEQLYKWQEAQSRTFKKIAVLKRIA